MIATIAVYFTLILFKVKQGDSVDVLALLMGSYNFILALTSLARIRMFLRVLRRNTCT